MTVATTTAAFLTVEIEGTRYAGALDRRILIGRRPSNNIVIDDGDVSRFHAWIGRDSKGFFVIDLASRSGTRVDDELVLDRRYLQDGEEITIGRATLVFGTQPPEGLALKKLDPPEVEREGILFDCVCGAPLWAPRKSAGRPGKCGHCRKTVVIPERSGQRAAVAPRGAGFQPASSSVSAVAREAGYKPESTRAPRAARQEPGRPTGAASRCPVCQWQLSPTDKTTTCPECGQVYHDDCWTQNEGCAIYGCSQVHSLRPDAPKAVAAEESPEPEDAAPPPPPPKQTALLAAAIVAVPLSLLSFGLPSLVTAAVAVLMLRRRQATRTGLVAIVASLAGVVGGLIGSYLWWIGRP